MISIEPSWDRVALYPTTPSTLPKPTTWEDMRNPFLPSSVLIPPNAIDDASALDVSVLMVTIYMPPSNGLQSAFEVLQFVATVPKDMTDTFGSRVSDGVFGSILSGV